MQPQSTTEKETRNTTESRSNLNTMKNRTEIETDSPEELKRILEPSLETDETVTYNLEINQNKLVIETETEKISTLRACTDNIFRLSMLATKI